MINRRWVHSGPPNYPFTLNRESPQAKGLVGWWPTLGSQGTNVLLDKYLRQDGIFPGGIASPAWTESSIGAVLLYDNANTFFTVPTNSRLSNLSEFTVSCWASVLSSSYLVHKRVSNDIGWIFWTSGQSLRGWVYTDGIDAASSSDFLINLGQTHLFTMTYSNSTSRQSNVYLDGAEVTYSSQPTATGSLGDDSSQDMIIGKSPFGFTNGTIGEMRIYNRVLTPIEVRDQYQNPWELYQPLHQPLVFAPTVAAGAIMNQFQGSNVGADLFDGTLLIG